MCVCVCVWGGGGGGGGGQRRFRILVGGPNSQQAHDVILTSIGCNDVVSTSFRGHVPTRFLAPLSRRLCGSL